MVDGPPGRNGAVPRLGGSEPPPEDLLEVTEVTRVPPHAPVPGTPVGPPTAADLAERARLAQQARDEATYDDETEVSKRSLGVPEDSPARALVGRVVAGRFRLASVLGEGGMGAVFEAEHLELGNRVALKVLTAVAAREANATQRFVREARSAANIDSEHVVKVFDIGEDIDLGLYMVMELLRGEDLGARIARRGLLRAREAVTIAAQVASALDAAHKHGVIHRDLKPQNVFLCKRPDGTLLVKVVDFGVAKLVRDARRSAPGAITRSGMAVGTPQYMSPEQAQVMIVDTRADIYALGAVLYEMLVGVPPVPLLPYEQTIVHIVLKGAAKLQPGPAIPAALARLVNEMLAPRKDDRPGSAGEVLTRLQAIAAELPQTDLDSRAPPSVVRSGAPPAVTPVRSQPADGPKTQPRRLIVEEAEPLATPEDDEDFVDVVPPVKPLVGRMPLLVVVSLGMFLLVLGIKGVVGASPRADTSASASTTSDTTLRPPLPSARNAIGAAPASAAPSPVATAPSAVVASASAAPSASASAAPVAVADAGVAAAASAAPTSTASTGSRVQDARIAIERGDLARAIAISRDVVASDPTRADAWLILGAAHEMQGRAGEARAAYKNCAEQGRGAGRGECAALLAR